MRALVTDAHIRSGVAGLRALGQAGIEVVAFGPRWSSAGLWSRHPTVRSVGPDAIADPEGFTAAVVRQAERYGPMIVYPGQEGGIDPVLEAARRSSAVLLPYPGEAELRALRDKRALPSLAEEAGLAAPRTLVEATADELAARRPSLPCVIKRTRLGSQARARVVESDDELRAVLSGLPADERVLVQERVRGPLVGLAVVIARDGGVVARLQQVALRTWPAEAGGSSLAVSTAPDEKLTRGAARMLARVGYWGLAQLQFIDTARGPALIDVNTRFYGSMPLALACGVNLAAAWHAVALDRPVPAPSDYRTGVSYRSLKHELSAAVRGSPGLLVRRAPRPTSGALWARDDPVPSVLLTAQAVSVPLGRRLAPPVRSRARLNGQPGPGS